MPKVILDPVKQTEQFKADLAAMAAGQQRDPNMPVQKRILRKNFGPAGQHNNEWSAILEDDETIEDALSPKFWSGQAEAIRGHAKTKGLLDIIVVRKPSTLEIFRLLIVGIGDGYVQTRLLDQHVTQETAVPEGGFSTRWNAGKKCHEVIRKADKALMASDFQTKEAAAAWIADHLAKMAA